MRTPFSILIMMWLPLLAWGQANKKKQAEARPNIVLIMADDLGFSDLGCYGSEIATPHLDRLAAEGTRLTQFYNNAICAPTRASLLTGLYPHQTGIGYFEGNFGLDHYPAYQGRLNRQCVTMGEVFRSAGYSTLMSGKWHVGSDGLNWPNQRGFDEFFGILGGASSFFDVNLGNGKKGFILKNNQKLQPADGSFYMTDEITRHAVEFLDKQQASGKPFFLYLPYTSPHWPLHALPQDLAKYKGRYDSGWDGLRKQRHARQLALGIVAEQHPISQKNADLPDWNKLTYDEQRLWAAKMEVHAAMVDNLDQNIGRLLDKLKALGQLDNTLVIFLSDNGAAGEDIVKRANFVNIRNTGPVGTAGSYESFTRTWAYASNTPFRSFKGFQYEGGISSPLIAWYPKRIAAGQIATGSPTHLVDLLPTFLAFAKATYPQQFGGNPVQPLEGENFFPLLEGKPWQRTKPIYWERGNNKAIRVGQWKLVAVRSDQWELYDLATDRGETRNLAATYPEKVRELAALYDQWAKRVGVQDWEKIGAGKGFEEMLQP